MSKSKQLWSHFADIESKENEEINHGLLLKITHLYSTRFYHQEIIAAAKEQGTHFFVAPFMASAQIAYFMREKLVHGVCGSPLAFLYDVPQVIIDFNHLTGYFNFIDKGRLLEKIGPLA